MGKGKTPPFVFPLKYLKSRFFSARGCVTFILNHLGLF